jgi:peptidyl-prolyl cis-trans isomerase A (cyclophilin A)
LTRIQVGDKPSYDRKKRDWWIKKTLIPLLVLGAWSVILFARPEANPVVAIHTDIGTIKVEIYEKQAPVTAANFLRYVDKGLFRGASFYRVVRLDNQPMNKVKIEVIQGGLEFSAGRKDFSAIEHETTAKTGVLHKDGVISMARDAPGSATSEFFISIGDQPELDFGGRRNPDGQGFAAFGKVIEGMDVVRKIQQQPAEGQRLIHRVSIRDIVRVG